MGATGLETAVRQEPCPGCGAPMAVDPRFPSWCAGCGWGVRAPEAPAGATGRGARLSRRVARRLDDLTTARLVAADGLRPRPSAARAGALVIAVATLAFWLGLGVAAILLVALAWDNPFADLLAIVLAILFVLMRPRLGRVPREGVVTREEAPALHALVDAVAQRLGSRPPDVVALDARYNASWGAAGLRRRRVLTLGLPLLAALDDEAVVALVAHEVGHEANGDPLRGLLLGSAESALDAFVHTLSPEYGEGAWKFGGFANIANALMRILVSPFAALRRLQLLLVLRDSQRGEYLANHRAALVAGTDAEIRSAEALLLGPYLNGVLQRHALDGRQDGATVIAELRAAARAVPEHEWERRRRVAALEAPELLSTHPATARRLEIHRRRAPLPATVTLDGARRAALAAELARHDAEAGRILVDRWRGGRRMA